MKYIVREATAEDVDAIEKLLPRLADFEIPKRRSSEELWRSDEQMMLSWAAGTEPNVIVKVAQDNDGNLAGVAIIRMRKEMLSRQPSAHLEVLAVAEGVEGNGIGQSLVEHANKAANELGALTITLHVFGVNSRARALYEKMGYEAEIIRYIKDLTNPSENTS